MHALLGAGGARGLEGLDRCRRDALHEDAAQQLQAGGVARARADDVDRHAERPEQLGEALGARSGRERGRREAGLRDDPDQRDVRERHRQRVRELALESWGGRVQVGVERVRAELRGDAGRRSERDGRGVDAEHDVGAPDRLAIARGVDDSLRPADGIPAANRAAGRDEIGGDPAAGLAEAEHRDLHQPSTISRSPFRS